MAVISKVATIVAALHPNRIVRVGVDGVDGAGKTVFADELAEAIAPLGRHAIRAGVDGFHHPRKLRHHRGRSSPEGFLHRPELHPYWDYSIFLDAAFDVSIPRCAQRDDSDPDPSAPSNRRYVEGQLLYLDHCRPYDHASTVIDNNNMSEPHITRLSAPIQPH